MTNRELQSEVSDALDRIEASCDMVKSDVERIVSNFEETADNLAQYLAWLKGETA